MDYFKSTKFKLFVASILYKFLKVLRFSDIQLIKRNGINFEVDLREGIDLSLYFFGSFQKHVWQNTTLKLPSEPIIFDVGANIGSISLFLANHYKGSKVYAFEPTDFAFKKLCRNIRLNPNLESSVYPFQVFVDKKPGVSKRTEAYSSWKIDGSKVDHPIHGGINKEATKNQISLDIFAKNENLTSVDFLKIDVDGYEMDILEGSTEILSRYNPYVIFEFMGHSGVDLTNEFKKFDEFFKKQNYSLYESKSMKPITIENVVKLVPQFGGIDIIAKKS